MKAKLAFLAIFILAVLVGSALYNQKRTTLGQTQHITDVEVARPQQAHIMYFPYYTLYGGFRSSLILVNASSLHLTATLVIYNLSGRAAQPPALKIGANQKISLDLGTVLASLSADVTDKFAEGSVAVYFSAEDEMPLVGQITITNVAQHLSFESEMVDLSPGMNMAPRELNSVWWGLRAGRDARFAVSNTTDNPAVADVFLDFGGERHPSDSLRFRPRETKVLSLIQLLGELKASPSQAPEGGITIIPRDTIGGLIAQGYMIEPATGFSTTLHFLKPQFQKASVLYASGVPIGEPTQGSPYEQAGTFTPHVIVRNLNSTPQNVTIVIEYPGSAGPEQTTLPSLTVSGSSTTDVSLETYAELLPLPLPYCSIRIQYSGSPGSAIAEVASVEENEDLVIDSRLANEADEWAGSGTNPWHLDNETESVVFLTNMGDQECGIVFRIDARGAADLVDGLRLKPHETLAINVRKLRDQSRWIPHDATDGSVSWGRMDPVPVTGRLVVFSRTRGMASSYDCCTCSCVSSSFSGNLYIDTGCANVLNNTGAYPTTFAVAPNNTITLSACKELVCPCNPCSKFYQADTGATWNSSNTSVATVGGANGGMVTGVGIGQATITASVTRPFWTCCSSSPQNKTGSGTGTINVQVPSSLSVISVTTIATNTPGGVCITGQDFGIQVATTYQVWDNRNPPKPIQGTNMEPQEKLLNLVFCAPNCGSPTDVEPNWVDIGPTKISGTSKYTSSTGTFVDAPVGTCANGAFTQTETQPISILIGTSRYSVRTNNFTISSSSSGHGSIANGSDISKSR